MILRKRFSDVIARQIDAFEREQADLIADCEAAERAYDRAERDEAEERYTEALAALRDNYASTLPVERADEYEQAFNRAVRKRLPRFALDIENT